MKQNEMQMTTGPMLGKMIAFAVPLILSGLLQITFNAADSAVVGRFAENGSLALASIGATTALIHLLINLFIGLATGTLIAVSYALGAGNGESARLHAHNAIATALISGILIGTIGIVIARPVLSAMDTPPEALDGAVLYFRIYFAGAPLFLLYNFGGSILRALGDTRRPFLYLTIGGVVNILLNLFFVIVLRIAVAGVAIATVMSNGISAALVLRFLMKADTPCRIQPKNIRIHWDQLKIILRYGIPAGLQNCMFSISNVLIQSSINSFGQSALTGNTAASNISGYYDICTSAMADTALTFVSRNYGAGQYRRSGRAALLSLAYVSVTSLLLSLSAYALRVPLLSIFIRNDPEAIRYGSIRLFYLALPNITAALMSVLSACIRALEKPVYPMLTTLFGVCVVRIIYLYTVFRAIPTIDCLYFSYPFTWTLTDVFLAAYLFVLYRTLKKRPQRMMSAV